MNTSHLGMSPVRFAAVMIWACSFSAQAQSVAYPYMPDENADELVQSSDLLSLLSVFGMPFQPDPITVDSLTLEEYLQGLHENISNANEALDNIPMPDCDPCDGLTEVTYGSETYPVVAIGCECWFAKNLSTYVFANSDVIPTFDSEGADGPWQVWANNNPIDGARFGRMYSQGARNDPRKLCPSDWKVPNALDATSLQAELGGPSINGTAALLALPQDPVTGLDYLPYADGTNNFGFNGVPLNGMQEAGAMLYGSLNNGMLWGHESSAYGYTSLGGGFSINTGYSVAYPVRCVKYQDDDRGCTDANYIEFEPTALLEDGSCLTEVVRGCTNPDANNFNPDANTEVGSCAFGSQPPACAFVDVYDYHGTSYSLVEVAGHCWFGENLRTALFANGDPITVHDDDALLSEPWYVVSPPVVSLEDNDAFGFSYNQAAVSDNRNVCPSGWHVSELEDWDALATLYGGYLSLIIDVAAHGNLEDASGYWQNGDRNRNRSGLSFLPINFYDVASPAANDGTLIGQHLSEGMAIFGQSLTEIVMMPFPLEAAYSTSTTGGSIRCVKN